MDKIGATVGAVVLGFALIFAGYVIGKNVSCIKLPGSTACLFTKPVG